jgi:hypothetical protein
MTDTNNNGNVRDEVLKERRERAKFIFSYCDACARERGLESRRDLSMFEYNRLMAEARQAFKTGLFTLVNYVSPRETGTLVWHEIIDGLYNGLYVSNNYGLYGPNPCYDDRWLTEVATTPQTLPDSNGAYDSATLDILVEYTKYSQADFKAKHNMVVEDVLDYMVATHEIYYDAKADIYTNVPFDINNADAIWGAFFEALRKHRGLYFAALGEVA